MLGYASYLLPLLARSYEKKIHIGYRRSVSRERRKKNVSAMLSADNQQSKLTESFIGWRLAGVGSREMPM